MITKKKLIGLAYAMLALVLITLLLLLSKEFITNYFVRFRMDELAAPGAAARVLIFAPHNDDEALGAANLIAKTVANKGQVKVVLMTNGDGYKHAIEMNYLKAEPQPEDYIRFGYTRQKETVRALESLGLAESDIVFLGYPDGGLASLWNASWDTLYTSRFTQADRSPYANSMTKEAPYTGESVLADIGTIIREFQPTHVVYPHPNDRHPDHWATYAFVKTALTQMDYHPQKQWLYLVHRGDWPTPLRQSVYMYLTPPAKLIGLGTQWYALDMDDAEISQKEAAINTYKSQLRTLGALLSAFERKSELFGVYENGLVAQRNREDAAIVPDAGNFVISDPAKDKLRLEINEEADIVGVYAEIAQNGNLHIVIQTVGNIGKRPVYVLNLMFFDHGQIRRGALQVKDGQLRSRPFAPNSLGNMPDMRCAVNAQYLQITIPAADLGDYTQVFINAQTFLAGYFLDGTAWHMCDVSGSAK